MIALLPLEHYPLFLAACVVLVLTPGPNLLYLISRTLCQGRAAGLISLAGTSTGFVFHILAAALGLSAILLAVPILYDVLRWLGAAYLMWLAFDSIRGAGGGLFEPRALRSEAPGRLYRTGLITSILNPKVALFYVALFPQFIVPARGHVLVQSLFLGATQILIAVIGDALILMAAARVSASLASRPRFALVQRWLQGGVFAAIAVRLAIDDRH
jgi:threonine/homoserine/homoserine lactone efflux protein